MLFRSAGEVGRRHAEAAGRVAGLRLAAVTDTDPDRARTLAQAAGARPVPDYDALLETTVVCARGRRHVDPSGATVVDADGRDRRVIEVDPAGAYQDSFVRQYEALRRTLRDGVPPEVTPAEGRTAVATMCALYASAAAGGTRMEVA